MNFKDSVMAKLGSTTWLAIAGALVALMGFAEGVPQAVAGAAVLGLTHVGNKGAADVAPERAEALRVATERRLNA